VPQAGPDRARWAGSGTSGDMGDGGNETGRRKKPRGLSLSQTERKPSTGSREKCEGEGVVSASIKEGVFWWWLRGRPGTVW
jgi:hypothetical protein